MHPRNRAGVCALVLLATALPVRGDVTVLEPSRDATLFFSTAGNPLSAGGDPYLFIGNTGLGEARRSLVLFDVAASLPPGSIVIGASLTMTVTRTTSFDSEASLHRVTSDWGEGSNVTTDPFHGGGIGDPAQTGDATWTHAFFPATAWATPGGDFVPEVSAVTTVGLTGAKPTWVGGETMIADVQGWMDAPAGNFGWIILGDESSAATAKRLGSGEEALAGNRPGLTIEFLPPGCGDIDFNNDEVFPDIVDLDEFLDVFAGGECDTGNCDDIDFNNDGVFPDFVDLESFLRVFSGGEC